MTDPEDADAVGPDPRPAASDGGRDSRETLAERRGDTDSVYGAAEDSQLLATAAAEAVEANWRVLDVGTGSGFVAARVREQAGADVVASDVNPHACRQAREAGLLAVRADLVSPFADGAFDAVLFNPPYLPTPEDSPWDDWMETAISGGEGGREVVAPFLDAVGRVLASDGVALLLVSSVTDLDAVEELAADAGFDAEVVAEESYPYERLVVLALR